MTSLLAQQLGLARGQPSALPQLPLFPSLISCPWGGLNRDNKSPMLTLPGKAPGTLLGWGRGPQTIRRMYDLPPAPSRPLPHSMPHWQSPGHRAPALLPHPQQRHVVLGFAVPSPRDSGSGTSSLVLPCQQVTTK